MASNSTAKVHCRCPRERPCSRMRTRIAADVVRLRRQCWRSSVRILSLLIARLLPSGSLSTVAVLLSPLASSAPRPASGMRSPDLENDIDGLNAAEESAFFFKGFGQTICAATAGGVDARGVQDQLPARAQMNAEAARRLANASRFAELHRQFTSELSKE